MNRAGAGVAKDLHPAGSGSSSTQSRPSSSATASPRAHTRLVAGRYRLFDVAGCGGSGVVWRAMDDVLGRQVAVKELVPIPGLIPSEQQILQERVRREARTAARLNHPHIITVHDMIEDDGRPWIVMELLRCRSLAHLITDHGPLSPPQTATIGLHTLAALCRAHRHGVVHRDVKPANILVDDRGRAVLTDFGFAADHNENPLTTTGFLVGTAGYIAPERARGRPAEPASDLWSLGVTLYTAIEGRGPYDRDTPLATITAAAEEEPDPMRLGHALKPLIDRLLNKDPRQRPTPEQIDRELRKLSTAATGGSRNQGHRADGWAFVGCLW
ncbi:serine/threonine protein kinase [Kibdelosporangium banguiense]|uniref:non-specific serine/threonine protein kinase n=1 Tax=Kibdelosporangium banguiense TaxID=1365924 RepID=A0ABS4TW17_9PSEU|nr:serine/threonine-protein kinase [Kibdelosporangium banguiense]MBP2328587.1 serine/threonine protein kinase [Kibdelosporangium banguiense]